MKNYNYNRNQVIDTYKTWRGILIIIIIIMTFICNNLWKDYKYLKNETDEYLSEIKRLSEENYKLKNNLTPQVITQKESQKEKKEIKIEKKIIKKEVKVKEIEKPIVEKPEVIQTIVQDSL